MKKFSILTWNLNSRTNDVVVEKQINFLKDYSPDIITLQEVTINSASKITNQLEQIGYQYIINSFDLFEDDISILKGKRKYGQIIASKSKITPNEPNKFNIPFTERVLSVNYEYNNKNIKIHTTHAPPGSSNGVIKVNHFKGIYDYFLNHKDEINILTGDFNTPQVEHAELGLITWGQKLINNDKVIFSKAKESDGCTPKEWDDSERKIMSGLPKIGIKDVFREIYSYEVQEYSWILNRKGKTVSRRRYDHIFACQDFKYNSAEYLHYPLESKISDHSALIVELEI